MDSNERIVKKLEDISEKQAEMNVTLAQQAVSLREHMRRTEVLEVMSQDYRDEMAERFEVMRLQIRPLEVHVDMMRGAAKVAAATATVIGIAVGIAKIFF